jgi:hypothetical protein
MQEKNIQNIINERMSQLPEVVRNEITNGDWEEVVRKIVEDNGLLIDQGLVIEKQTLFMMLGLENPKNYTKKIKKLANLSNETAVNIAYEIDEKILQKIKRKIVEAAEEEEGLENNPLKDIIGPKQQIDELIPDIDLEIGDVKNDEEQRKDLINELQDDIEIEEENSLEKINQEEKEWLEEANENEKSSEINISKAPENLPTEKPEIKENQIPFRQEKGDNPRVIETDFSNQPDNLPGLEPLRTLETDSKNKDDIVSSKFGGTKIQKPEDNEIPKKSDGPDPYREPVE